MSGLFSLDEELDAMQVQPKDRTINYVEFKVASIERTKKFYSAAFGWTFKDYGPDYCEFSDGNMSGGFEHGNPANAGGPLVVLFGDNLDQIAADILAAGGSITVPIFEFPGGRRFHFTDPDGYELAVWTTA